MKKTLAALSAPLLVVVGLSVASTASAESPPPLGSTAENPIWITSLDDLPDGAVSTGSVKDECATIQTWTVTDPGQQETFYTQYTYVKQVQTREWVKDYKDVTTYQRWEWTGGRNDGAPVWPSSHWKKNNKAAPTGDEPVGAVYQQGNGHNASWFYWETGTKQVEDGGHWSDWSAWSNYAPVAPKVFTSVQTSIDGKTVDAPFHFGVWYTQQYRWTLGGTEQISNNDQTDSIITYYAMTDGVECDEPYTEEKSTSTSSATCTIYTTVTQAWARDWTLNEGNMLVPGEWIAVGAPVTTTRPVTAEEIAVAGLVCSNAPSATPVTAPPDFTG